VSGILAEGGYQEFTLRGGEWAVLFLSAGAALVAIAVGFYLAKSVMAADAGWARTTNPASLVLV
jgi:hypothetical protein